MTKSVLFHIDDDIKDEEFCDDQLEAYFEKLALLEMQVGDTEEAEHDKCMKAMMELLPEKVSLSKNPWL